MLKDKKIVLGVSGGIAAYKAAALTSKLVQAGAKVKVILTESATQFVTPLTFQALSREPVYTNTFVEPDPNKIAHIELADWADAMVIAPATANIIGKLANGLADDMLSTTLLATKAPIFVAPAMNVNMYEHQAVQRNMQQLVEDGVEIIDANAGYLACGWIGKGRLAEPEEIVTFLDLFFIRKERMNSSLRGKKVVISAGPTQEKIDPVRYFTNHSSGKMGYAIAHAAYLRGAEVTLVSGPTNLMAPVGIKTIHIESAKEMYEAVTSLYDEADIVIKSAAVADYRPAVTYTQKRKKEPGAWAIEMDRTKDILATLGARKQKQILVGFAAETENIEQNALGKLERKHLDLIVANDISQEGAGFKGDTNEVIIYTKDAQVIKVPKAQKSEVADTLLNEIEKYEQRNLPL
ncbi:peptidase ClpP [Alkalihalobacillus alcalophilus ATCC 27647 = CGMCC 1.3604]|uniref:Coenzyme A biosynthesis bifunctional protein CoaBC n=1 Tax=Alkalihalobacillus alcalophilus ATCC 27647 = CGMCC 1.3604 TaxID=1218173 RepID=A0A4S4K3I8_ALKAL|nr:bifunctional phosphopantothenoylcysteine decarboxylase/phosphopantothenate--cysteine ligase CoaBC [Alkalihalobacillus alcalophilus]MED1563149.1 bifunctional phosphopantothenoylcysteine decarboxylase/phosphopantothenate--cysteine ligase CoaBC [Alkalihalobacillus alcalophilus]THG91820.1 peptidase ClpP [Alkalihalobacillus alcalophilus ATCC 27647 = CGMCC 1.3604]